MSKKNSLLSSAYSIKNHHLTGLLNTLFCVALLASASASAANESLDTDDDVRWFQVELILFAHNNPQALDAEQWPEIVGIELPLKHLQELHLPLDDKSDESNAADELNDGSTTTQADTTVDAINDAVPLSENVSAEIPTGPIAFQVLDKSAWQLKKTEQHLQRSSRFEPLLHIAWQQPTYALAQAKPVLLYDGMTDPLPPQEHPNTVAEAREPADETINITADAQSTETLERVYASEADTLIGPKNPRLIGTVKLSVARYLHLATDLLYRLPTTQQNAVPVSDFDLWYDRPYPTLYEPQGPAFRLKEWQAIRGFRMLESRRMRSKELHYLDHPMFGMVVLITPVKQPEAEDAEVSNE